MPREHVIRHGETIAGIAFETGHWWRTIWDDQGNEALREVRTDPQLLREGDRVHVPDLRKKTEAQLATGQSHRFRRKGVPSAVRLTLLEEVPEEASTATGDAPWLAIPSPDRPLPRAALTHRPRKGVPFEVDVDGQVTSGRSDGEGVIEFALPPNARQAVLTLNPGTDDEEIIPLQVGALDPPSFVRGQKQRLHGLGFFQGELDDDATPAFLEALQDFQRACGLPTDDDATQADDATCAQLVARFGA